MATAPTSTAQTRNARIRWSGVDFGNIIRPKTSCASAPVMLTSNPLKVLMNAANAPAQVMPLRIEPQGMPFFFNEAFLNSKFSFRNEALVEGRAGDGELG